MKDAISPRPEIVLPAGLLAAFLLAVGLALVREYLDQTFTRGEEVPRILDVPLLFSIPKDAVRSRSVRTVPASKPAPRAGQGRTETTPIPPSPAGALATAERGGFFSGRSGLLTAFATVIIVGLVVWAATGSAGAPEFNLSDLNPLNFASRNR